jgi:hypothetical protein
VRKGLILALTMIMAASALVLSSQAENVSMRGDYVEVRTASVFAGACHYNGEFVTTGRVEGHQRTVAGRGSQRRARAGNRQL